VVLWSEFLATDPEVRVRFPTLADFWKVVDLERGPLSRVSTTEELLGIKSSGSSLENREYYRRDSSRWPLDILNPQKLAITSRTNGGRSVGIVRSRTEATDFFFFLVMPDEVQNCWPSTQICCACSFWIFPLSGIHLKVVLQDWNVLWVRVI
jgi:hypothetical protein